MVSTSWFKNPFTRAPAPFKNTAGVQSLASDVSEDSKSDPSTPAEKKEPVYDISSAEPLAPRRREVESANEGLLVIFGLRKSKKAIDLDAVATEESVFEGPLAEHYLPSKKWENYAFFDPSFRWTYRQERSVTRKTDFKIFAWILLMFTALNICRSNITRATADNLLEDLNITQADYNLGNSLFRIGFLVAELPSQIIGKKLGVDVWLPIQMIAFSVLTSAQFWMKGRAVFLAFRFTIALFQGGFIPDVILYLTYYYTKHQLPIRLAIFWCINSGASLLSGFLAVGLLEMRGIRGKPGWAWMFLLEGLLSLLIGIASFFMMPPGPSQTKSKLRPTGVFNDDEVKIIVNRTIRDDHTKASMHNRESLSPKLFFKALADFDLWPMYIVGLMFGIPGYPVTNYFQLSMRRLGFSTLMANLLSIPNVAITMISLVGVTFLSELVNNRWLVCSIENWWFLPLFIALRVVPELGPWEYFAVATLLLGYPYVHALQVSWISRNSGHVRTRTVSAALYNMFVQASGIIGANIYVASDAPRYEKGNSVLLGIIAFNLVILYPGTALYYKLRNAHKRKSWDAMTIEQQSIYLSTTTAEGCKRLDFQFVY